MRAAGIGDHQAHRVRARGAVGEPRVAQVRIDHAIVLEVPGPRGRAILRVVGELDRERRRSARRDTVEVRDRGGCALAGDRKDQFGWFQALLARVKHAVPVAVQQPETVRAVPVHGGRHIEFGPRAQRHGAHAREGRPADRGSIVPGDARLGPGVGHQMDPATVGPGVIHVEPQLRRGDVAAHPLRP